MSEATLPVDAPVFDVSILEQADTQDLKRLLELFPLPTLRRTWPDLKGTKEEICFAIAQMQDYKAQIEFINANLSCCRQHVYVFDQTQPVTLPAEIEEGKRVYALGAASSLYIIRVRHTVVLKEPLEPTYVDFLWPVRIEQMENHLVVRFGVLERRLTSYFERSFYVEGRSVEEDAVIENLASVLSLTPSDLHKGIKRLWDNDFMDSVRVDYKRPNSKASETMDEEQGIKATDPDLYEELQGSPLINTIFQINPARNLSVSYFSAKPATGYIAFLRYTENGEDTDYVIREVLRSNQ